MSLKFGLTIGAIWTGAAAFTASEKALLAGAVIAGFPACTGMNR